MDSRFKRGHKSGELALTEGSVERLFRFGVTDLAHEALYRLAIMTGIRRGDIVRIELKDVEIVSEGDCYHGVVKFWEKKKRRFWSSYIDHVTCMVLKKYINTLRGKRFLFPSCHGGNGSMSSKTAYNWLQRDLSRAGLRGRPFHALRATCMKLLAKRGWSDMEIGRQTGDSIRVINRVYRAPSEDDMVDLVRGEIG